MILEVMKLRKQAILDLIEPPPPIDLIHKMALAISDLHYIPVEKDIVRVRIVFAKCRDGSMQASIQMG